MKHEAFVYRYSFLFRIFFFFHFLSDLIGKRKIKNQCTSSHAGVPGRLLRAPSLDAEGPEGCPRWRLSGGSCDCTINTPFISSHKHSFITTLNYMIHLQIYIIEIIHGVRTTPR